MSKHSDSTKTDLSMLELFRTEVENNARVLCDGLMRLEANPDDPNQIEPLMRAAHSIKGAGRVVGVDAAVEVAHALESALVATENTKSRLSSDQTDVLLRAVDTLSEIAALSPEEHNAWTQRKQKELQSLVSGLVAIPAPDATTATGDTKPAENTSDATRSAPPASKPATDATLYALFRQEAQTLIGTLNEGLVELERNPSENGGVDSLMRAAHSLKGAARLVDVPEVVEIADAVEDCFSAVQKNRLSLSDRHVGLLLRGVDALSDLTQLSQEDYKARVDAQRTELNDLSKRIRELIDPAEPVQATPAPTERAPKPDNDHHTPEPPTQQTQGQANQDRVLRVTAERLNRLMGLAGESVVESRWIRGHADSLIGLKHRQAELVRTIDALRIALEDVDAPPAAEQLIADVQHKADTCRNLLSERLMELEEHDRRATGLADRLNREVIASRMRPFADGVQGLSRMVRDMARSLDRKATLEIYGHNTQVDRDILDKIESPLNHLLRNAVDHGVEPPEERLAAGKPEQATIRLEAAHISGMLSITVSDDGQGIDLDVLREKILARNLVHKDIARELGESELLDFLFLPGFTTRDQITEISGRGVGLDVVHNVVQEMRGQIRATSRLGQGTRIQLMLPLTLSVMRSLLVEIGGQPYAFPLARIQRILQLPHEAVQTLEGRQYFMLEEQAVGLVNAAEMLELEMSQYPEDGLTIVVVGDRIKEYGLAVDRFLGERDLAVHVLDTRLGKIRDVAAGALADDGTPILIIDVDDVMRTIDVLVSGERLGKVDYSDTQRDRNQTRRVLVVDDSITVREVERQLLESRGYDVDVAVDGMDGWNTVRTRKYDLVVSDIDMPRMNGIEFVSLIKADPNLRSTPVMIVSYKDRQEDRDRGLEAGADYYLTKGSFHDESLVEAVRDLIGD